MLFGNPGLTVNPLERSGGFFLFYVERPDTLAFANHCVDRSSQADLSGLSPVELRQLKTLEMEAAFGRGKGKPRLEFVIMGEKLRIGARRKVCFSAIPDDSYATKEAIEKLIPIASQLTGLRFGPVRENQRPASSIARRPFISFEVLYR